MNIFYPRPESALDQKIEATIQDKLKRIRFLANMHDMELQDASDMILSQSALGQSAVARVWLELGLLK